MIGGGDHDNWKKAKKALIGGGDHDKVAAEMIKNIRHKHKNKDHKKRRGGKHDYQWKKNKPVVGKGEHFNWDGKAYVKDLIGGGTHDMPLNRKGFLPDDYNRKRTKPIYKPKEKLAK